MRTVDTPDGPMDVYVAEPGGLPRGGVVVVQEAFGLTQHIRSVADRLAADGWLAVTPALYHRTGAPVLAYDDFDAVRPNMASLSAEGIRQDVGAAVGLLEEAAVSPAARGIVGFCMGGTIALWAGTEVELGAAVTFYGGGVLEGRFGFPSLVELAPALRVPWQGHYGDLDRGIPVEQVDALRAAASTAPAPTEVWLYEGAGHGFNCDDREAFHAPSAATAWARTIDWFGTYLDGA